MVLSMAGFAVEDSLLKIAAVSLPPGQVLITFGVLGTMTFAALALMAGEAPLTRAMLGRPMILRSLSEVTGRLFYMLASALTPLSTASAILQATPLVVMVGAVLAFDEMIGPKASGRCRCWRSWRCWGLQDAIWRPARPRFRCPSGSWASWAFPC